MSMNNCTKARGKFTRAQQSETNEARLSTCCCCEM